MKYLWRTLVIVIVVVIAIGLLECGVKLYREMATFDDLS